MAFEGIGQIAINARVMDRAVAFYRDTLGLPLLFAMPKMAFFQCGGVRLMLGLPESAEFDHPASVIYFRVADIREEHRRLAAAGVEFRDEPHMIAKMPDHELWMTFFRDTEGNTLSLMSEVRG